MALMPDDIVPTANGKDMKSGYGVKTEVRATLSPLLNDTVIVMVWGVSGVCHFTHTSWESFAGMTMFRTV